MLRMVLPDGTIIHKIGITNRSRSTDRMMEILKSWFNYFRFVPYTEMKMDLECQDPAGMEKYIHKILKKRQFIPNHKVTGHTEMFTDLNEVRVINFLKSYNNSMYTTPPELTEDECNIMVQLLCPLTK